MSTKINSWDGRVYTLEDILEFLDACDGQECGIDDVLDGDLATAPTLMRGLVERVQELEDTVLKMYSILSARDVTDIEEAVALGCTAANTTRKELLKAMLGRI